MFEILTTLTAQGILGALALLSVGIMFYLNKSMGGSEDERVSIINLRGTNIVLWIFFILIGILFLFGPNDIYVFRKFIITSLYISMIATGCCSIYEYFIR